jgi:hypothetical protein
LERSDASRMGPRWHRRSVPRSRRSLEGSVSAVRCLAHSTEGVDLPRSWAPGSSMRGLGEGGERLSLRAAIISCKLAAQAEQRYRKQGCVGVSKWLRARRMPNREGVDWSVRTEQSPFFFLLQVFGRWPLRQDYNSRCEWKEGGRPGQPEGKKGKKGQVRSVSTGQFRIERRWILAIRVGDAPARDSGPWPLPAMRPSASFRWCTPADSSSLLGVCASRWGNRATASWASLAER